MKVKFLIGGMTSLCALPVAGAIACATEAIIVDANKERVIIDTDVGNDCDDIGALSVLGNAYRRNMIKVEAVTVCNQNIHAIHTTDIMLEQYGIDCPLGKSDNDQPVVAPEYAEKVDEGWTARSELHPERIEWATPVLRKALVKAEKGGYKIKLITLGMLNNIANLLESKGDKISPKTGRELFEENVSEMVLMGGRFDDQEYTEFNIIQAIDSSKIVINEPSSVPKTFCGWEVGGYVYSGQTFYDHKDSPQCVAYETYNHGNLRESWDPLTMFTALNGAWAYSKMGKVKVEINKAGADGCTKFYESPDGIDRYILVHPDSEQLAEQLEQWYTVVKN